MPTPPTRRVGFVDDDLNNFHADVYRQLLEGDLAHRGFALAGCHALQTDASRAWAQEHGVTYYDDLSALAEAVDCFMILAPGTPQTHMHLCERVFPLGKPTFVDKTFAPDLDTAKRIFALADACNIPIQSSSALRYTDVQQRARQLVPQHMVAWGGGRSVEEYAIHPTEMVISCMGAPPARAMWRGRDDVQLVVDYPDGRSATINIFTGLNPPSAAALTAEGATEFVQVDRRRLFADALNAILDFFETGEAGIDRTETLAVRQLLDVLQNPAAEARFIDLPPIA